MTQGKENNMVVMKDFSVERLQKLNRTYYRRRENFMQTRFLRFKEHKGSE